MAKGWLEKYKVKVPEGRAGNFQIKKFTVSKSEADSFNTGLLFSGAYARRIQPGTYTRLLRLNNGNSSIVMSDTPAEIRDHLDVILEAKGHVLIAGLGFGMITKALTKKKEVLSITVIEIEKDIIKLVTDWVRYKCKRKVKIIHANIFEWKPHERLTELGVKKFDYAWFDIWDDGNFDLLEEKKKLFRKFGRFAMEKADWLTEILRYARH